jgi:ATP-dependent DNA helicase RecQ
MAYGVQDAGRVRQMVESSGAPERQKHVERQKLDALLGFCETARCRRQVLLEYLGDTCEPCGNCDTCLEPVETFDGTEAAQKALSAVYRTDQMFGAGHLIDVLLGAETEKTRRFAHDALSVFGVGKDLSKVEWRSVFRQLIALGLLRVDMEGHGALVLGPDVRPVLRGERTVELRRDPAAPRGRSAGARSSRAAAKRALFDDPAAEALFQALRAKRSELAHAQGVPPYVIFNDKTLVEMALERPLDAFQMARINGVGETKLERYGAAFLDVIASVV